MFTSYSETEPLQLSKTHQSWFDSVYGVRWWEVQLADKCRSRYTNVIWVEFVSVISSACHRYVVWSNWYWITVLIRFEVCGVSWTPSRRRKSVTNREEKKNTKLFWWLMHSNRKRYKSTTPPCHPKNCAINTFFHLFYRSASNDSLPLPLSFFRRLSSPSADSVQITSVLSLHSFIFHRRAKIAPCCSPSFAFITGAARERQQAAPSDPRLCCLLDCHVTGACWLGKFSGSHHTY